MAYKNLEKKRAAQKKYAKKRYKILKAKKEAEIEAARAVLFMPKAGVNRPSDHYTGPGGYSPKSDNDYPRLRCPV